VRDATDIALGGHGLGHGLSYERHHLPDAAKSEPIQRTPYTPCVAAASQ
jgi:hypothetical protein